jgi:Fe-S cluster assembly protein SufB
MKEPHWPNVHYNPIDYQAVSYYSAPKTKKPLGSLDEVDPELLKTYQRLGIPLTEQKILSGVAVDAIFDSVSVGTTMRTELAKHGIIFCSLGEAIREHSTLVEKYLGSVVPYSDNFFAALNSAVFSDGSFVYVRRACAVPSVVDNSADRPVRADADRRRRGLVRELSRGMRAQAQHEPAAPPSSDHRASRATAKY